MNRRIALTLLLGALAAGCGKKEGTDKEAPAASGAASGSAAPAAGMLDRIKEAVSNEITVQIKPPVVGSKRKVEGTTTTTMQLKMKNREMSFSEKTTSRRTEEVLAVDGTTVTRLKVSYEVNSKETTEANKVRTKPDLLAGKTFILEFAAGKVAVSSEDKKPVAGPAKLALLKEFKTFGQPDKVEAALNGKKLKVGEPVTGLDAELSEQLKNTVDDPRSGLVVDTPRMTLKRKDGDFAVFEVKASARATKGMMKGVVIDTTSEVYVHLTDNRSSKTTTSGTMVLTPDEQAKNKDLSLSGTITGESSATPI